MPPPHFARAITAEGAEHTSNIVGFEWVADQQALIAWMRKLHWVPAEYHMGYNKSYVLVLDKLGVFVNLHQNSACKAKEGWIPVNDGMKAVSEIAHERAPGADWNTQSAIGCTEAHRFDLDIFS